MSRDYDPKKGQWYEDLDREELFKVVSVDPDEILVRIQWLDGEIEDIDVDAWNELDLELASEPEGWVDDSEVDADEDVDEDDEDDLDDLDEDEDDDDDDWDDDEDEDEDYDDDDDEYRDRE